MKNIVKVLLGIVMLLVLQGYVMAIEEVLIDFSLLTADTPSDNPLHNSDSLLVFEDLYPTTTGFSVSQRERDLVRASLAIPQWTFTFNSSARQPQRIRSSSIRPATVGQSSARHAGQEVLGLRLNFLEGDSHSWALIEPPYTIPRVPQQVISGNDVDFAQRGVIDNISDVRSISVEVYGLNYPHSMSVLFEDTDGAIKEYMIGTLGFVGWRTLTWENPAFAAAESVAQPVAVDGAVDGVAEATDGAVEVAAAEPAPAVDTQVQYPKVFSSIALRGIRIWKNGSAPVGDFVGYIKEIRVDYDPETIIVDSDFDNEGIWNILGEDARAQHRRRQIRERADKVYDIIQTNVNN